MTALLVANMKTEETVGDLAAVPPGDRRFTGCLAQRLLWFARDGDVIIMPRLPDQAVLDYVTALTGTRRSTLRLVVPADGRFGADILSRDRLLSESCLDGVRAALGGRTADAIVAMSGDKTVAALARELGMSHALPGYGLAAAGGIELVNAKSTFRAIAGGVGAPMPPGWTGGDQAEARHFISGEFAAGHYVMVKQDLQSGGKGNVVLSPVPGVRVCGTKTPAVVLPGADDITAYLDRQWDWLTDGGRHWFVIERYFPDAIPVFAEFIIDDGGMQLTGYGEMLMTPAWAGIITPMPGLDPAVRDDLIATAKQICVPFWAMGYRGTASVDGLLTGDRLWLSEINCRMGGSSHLHGGIATRVLGPAHRAERLIVERDGWGVPSFAAAVHRLESTGLAYDPETRLGVILTCDVVPADGTVKCCVVAEDMDAVRKYEVLLSTIFNREDAGMAWQHSMSARRAGAATVPPEAGIAPLGACGTTHASERLGEDGLAVGVGAPLLHVGQVRLVGLNARRCRRVLLVGTGRVPASRALPGVRNRGIGGKAGPCLMLVRAPERHPDAGRGLATLSLSHRPRANPAAADSVATTHRSPLHGRTNERACGKDYVRHPGTAGKSGNLAVWPPALRVISQLVVDQPAQRADVDEPQDSEEDREPVQVPLDDRGGAKGGGHPAAEHVRQAAALALVQQDEQHHHAAGNDQDNG